MGLSVSVIAEVVTIVLNGLYVVMEIVNEIWKSPLDDQYRDWYKRQKQNNPKKSIQIKEIF